MTNLSVAHKLGRLGQDIVYPHFEYFSGTAAAMGTSAYLPDACSNIRFKTVSTGGETIKVSGSKNNSNFEDLYPIDESTGKQVTSVNLASGTYRLDLRKHGGWKFFKFTKSAAVQTGTVVMVCARPKAPSGRI